VPLLLDAGIVSMISKSSGFKTMSSSSSSSSSSTTIAVPDTLGSDIKLEDEKSL